MSASDTSSAPLVWILTGDKGGDNAQMRVLAATAGFRGVEVPLEYNGLSARANIRLGATTRTLTEQARARLQPPWPDLVLSSGGRSVPIARWIRKQSGGRTKLAHVGRPWGRLAWFDLVFAMPQYGLPSRRNVFHARMPFNRPTPEALAAATARWRARFDLYPRPWIGLVVGGRSAPYVLDAPAATKIGKIVRKRARREGGSVLAITSRRTSPAAVQALFEALGDTGFKYAWRPDDPDNPYLAILALADELVVTGDSASMLAEAISMQKPVSIAPLPTRIGRRRRRVHLMKGILPRRVFDWIVDLGLFTSVRDVTRLHRRLVREGLAVLLPAPPVSPPANLSDDLSMAASRLRSLIR